MKNWKNFCSQRHFSNHYFRFLIIHGDDLCHKHIHALYNKQHNTIHWLSLEFLQQLIKYVKIKERKMAKPIPERLFLQYIKQLGMLWAVFYAQSRLAIAKERNEKFLQVAFGK